MVSTPSYSIVVRESNLCIIFTILEDEKRYLSCANIFLQYVCALFFQRNPTTVLVEKINIFCCKTMHAYSPVYKVNVFLLLHFKSFLNNKLFADSTIVM